MKTKKYALLMALAVLGTGSVVFADDEDARRVLREKGCDDLAQNADAPSAWGASMVNVSRERYGILAKEIYETKKSSDLMKFEAECAKKTKKELEDLPQYQKYWLNNLVGPTDRDWHNEELEIIRRLIHSKQDELPAPSAKNNGVDTSNLDFSDSRTINKIYWNSFYDRNADLNFREKLEQKLKDFSSNKTFDELRRIYKNAYKSEGVSWYTGIVWDVIKSKEAQHLKELESKCESMDKNALEVALSEAEKKQSEGTGDGFVYYTYGKETGVIEKVLTSKKEKALETKALETKAAQEEIDAIKEKINKLKNEAKKAEPSPEAEPDPEVDYSWEPSDEGMDEEEPRPEKKLSKRRRASYQAKKQKRIMEEEEDLQSQERSYDEDAEGADEGADYDGFNKKAAISKEIRQYIVKKMGSKNKALSITIRDLAKKDSLDEEDWKALGLYMSKQNLKIFFEQYNKKNAGNVKNFNAYLKAKYKFLNSLLSSQPTDYSDKLNEKIRDAVREDTGIIPLQKSLIAFSNRESFSEIYDDINENNQENKVEEKFLQNEIDPNQFSNEMIVVISNKINKLITTKKEELQEEEEDDKERAREEKKIIDEVKNILSINLRDSTALINKIKSLENREDAQYGEFVNILKAMEKKDAKKAPVDKKAPARSRSLSPKKAPVGKKAPARSRSLSPKKSNRG